MERRAIRSVPRERRGMPSRSSDFTSAAGLADGSEELLLASVWLFLLVEQFFRTARSGPGRADRRGEAALDGENRSEIMM